MKSVENLEEAPSRDSYIHTNIDEIVSKWKNSQTETYSIYIIE